MKRNIFKNLVFIAVLVVMCVPVQSLAGGASSDGSANLNWTQFNMSIVPKILGTAVNVSWFDPTLPQPPSPLAVDTRASFSGISTTLNGNVEPYSGVDSADGTPWQNTYATAGQGTVPNSVRGSADTHSSLTAALDANGQLIVPAFATPDRIYAASSIGLTSGNSGAVLAEAVLSGQFWVDAASTLSVTVPYNLALQLTSTGSDLINSGIVTAALVLSDFWTTDPATQQSLVLRQDVQSLAAWITDTDSTGALTKTGTLSLTYDLLPFGYDLNGSPINVYDFEASATAQASVPEPISIVLLMIGMAGLGLAKRKFA